MTLVASLADQHGHLADRLRCAVAVTPELMAEVIAQAGPRFAALKASPAAARLGRMIEAGAFTDAALALLALELPQWQLRCLDREEGDWRCMLGRHAGLPAWLDDTVEVRHEVLALAVLSALHQARRIPAVERSARIVPRHGPDRGKAVCCDNFR